MAKRRRIRREFTSEQKAQAVQEYLASGESVYAVAKRLGTNYSTLYRWVADTRDGMTQPQPQAQLAASSPSQPQVEPSSGSLWIEVEDLRRANERLTAELENYKTATAYFAKEYFMRAHKVVA